MKKIATMFMSALMFAGMMVSCETDNGSNPTLVQANEFTITGPEYPSVAIDLAAGGELKLSSNVPVFTNNGAPVVTHYTVEVSLTDKWTRSFAQAEADTKKWADANGIKKYVVDSLQDYYELSKDYTTAPFAVDCAELNLAVSRLLAYTDASQMDENYTLYLRVRAYVANTGGVVYKDIYSNVVTQFAVATWEDPTVKAGASYLWVPGGGNGWNHGVAPILVSEESDGIYQGYAYMSGEFKFTPADNWDGEFNNGSFAGEVSDCIDLGDKAGGNLNYTGEASMTYIVVNTNTGDLTVTPCVWSIIGAFNSWGDDSALEMTYNTDKHCLTITTTFDDASDYKFRRDHDWTVNLGEDLNDLKQDGANLNAAAGEHTFNLYLERPSESKLHAEVK